LLSNLLSSKSSASSSSSSLSTTTSTSTRRDDSWGVGSGIWTTLAQRQSKGWILGAVQNILGAKGKFYTAVVIGVCAIWLTLGSFFVLVKRENLSDLYWSLANNFKELLGVALSFDRSATAGGINAPRRRRLGN